MKTKKISVFKGSNGKLYESEKEYYIDEMEYNHLKNIETFERYLDVVKSDPENFYKLINSIGMGFVNIPKEEIEKELNDNLEFIHKARKYKYGRYNESTEDADNFGEPSENWNASPGSWRGIDAQDLM